MTPIRLLIADDHAVVRRGLRTFLELQADMEVVGEAATGEDAVARASELDPDVVVMDVVMPSLDGIEATRSIRRRNPSTKVLTLSSFSDDDRVVAAFRAGASGYLLKDTDPERLADAIRDVHRGEPVLSREAIRGVLAGLVRPERRPEGTLTIAFTDIEGATALLDRLGEERAHALFEVHARVIRDTVERHGGTVVEKDGDAFLLAFPSARKAVACAVDVQRELARADAPRVRIGINTGEVVAEDDRLFGRAVFVAARVAAAAGGGEILTSELTRTLVGDNGVDFRDRGLHRLRGFAGEHRLFEVAWTRSAS